MPGSLPRCDLYIESPSIVKLKNLVMRFGGLDVVAF